MYKGHGQGHKVINPGVSLTVAFVEYAYEIF